MALRLSKRKSPLREDKPIKERDKITGRALDSEAVDAILNFINAKLIKSLDYPIAEGKESTVFRATAGENSDVRFVRGEKTSTGFRPDFFAVKVFKHDTSAFQHMAGYIEGDSRFTKAKKNRRALARQWAGKEFANLQLAQQAKAPLPQPVKRRGNVVVMEFIGNAEGVPYAKLQDVVLADPEEMLKMIIEGMHKLHSVGLVHGDLSPYNILVRSDDKGGQEPVFIDAGQAVLLDHPRAGQFLERDLYNILRYFEKMGVKADSGEKMKEITSKK